MEINSKGRYSKVLVFGKGDTQQGMVFRNGWYSKRMIFRKE